MGESLRNEDLLARAENPRRVIAGRFVSRGALLDRNNNPIASTAGKAGEFTRKYEYPPLSSSTGYNSPLYGQAGLEAGLDDYLRGIRGNPASLIWSDDLIYGQPPPGLNVRLTIDLETQKQADDLLANHKGALVLLNARSGEITGDRLASFLRRQSAGCRLERPDPGPKCAAAQPRHPGALPTWASNWALLVGP